ncbi:MAG: MBL fold metallo-hydrolase [Peptococcaceae bacterium]|nr:MBL fold metallo-hydrolase [Peptococcaceae bacterium]
MNVTFKLLGTGAGPGVPAFYCRCVACQEALDNPRCARTRSGALVTVGQETILIDASPDLRSQLIRERVESIDYVFLTHWHYDHFGGLGDLEFYVRLKRFEPLKLYLPSQAVDSFNKAFPFLADVFELKPWCFGQVYNFNGLKLTPLPAAHGVETAGIFLQNNKKLAYFTDTADLPVSTAEKIEASDYFICDATFYGENWYPQSHMSLWEAIALGKKVKARNIVLTHLSMHYSRPVTAAQLQQELRAYDNVSLSFDGMEFKI